MIHHHPEIDIPIIEEIYPHPDDMKTKMINISLIIDQERKAKHGQCVSTEK